MLVYNSVLIVMGSLKGSKPGAGQGGPWVLLKGGKRTIGKRGIMQEREDWFGGAMRYRLAMTGIKRGRGRWGKEGIVWKVVRPGVTQRVTDGDPDGNG